MITCLNQLFKNGEISEQAFIKLKNSTNEEGLKYIDDSAVINKKKFNNDAKRLQKDTDIYKNTVHDLANDITPNQAIKNLDDILISPNQKNVETTTKFFQAEFLRPILKNVDKWKKTYMGLKSPVKLYDSIGLKIMRPGIKVSDDATMITKDLEDSMKLINEQRAQHGLSTINLNQLANLSPKVVSHYTPSEFRDIMKTMVTDSDKVIDINYQKALNGDEFGKFNFTADGAQEYVKTFGGNPISNLNSYANRSAGEIAGVQLLGPNPIQKIKEIGRLNGSTAEQITNSENLYRQASNSVKQVQPDGKIAKATTSAIMIGKSLATVEMMGQAVFMTLVDPVTMKQASKLSGTPFMRQMYQGIKMMTSGKSLRDAQQMLGQAETVLMTMNNTMNRVDSHAGPSEFLNKAASTVLKGTGLARISEANIMASKMGTLMSLADNVTKSFSEIATSNPKFHKALIKYGVTEADWKKIRTTPRRGKNLFMDASKIDENVRPKIFRMMDEQANMSVIQPGAKTRNMLSFGDKGSLKNTAFSAGFQFKSSMVEYGIQNTRMFMSQTSATNKAVYTGEMMVGLAVMGMTINMLKDAAKGVSPEDPTIDPMKSLVKGFVRAGGGVFIATQLENMVDPKFYTNKTIPESLLDMVSPAALNSPYNAGEGLIDVLSSKSEKEVKQGMGNIAKEVANIIPNAPLLVIIRDAFKHQIGMWSDPAKEKKKQRRINSELKKNEQQNIFEL